MDLLGRLCLPHSGGFSHLHFPSPARGHPSVLLLGLYDLWQGTAQALQLYPYVPRHHSRRRQLLFSAACICLGMVWVPLSLTSWSTQRGPLIASTLPSLILALASSRCRG